MFISSHKRKWIGRLIEKIMALLVLLETKTNTNMKLYATITSNRAKKGQGGDFLDIEVLNEKQQTIMEINITPKHIYATTFGKEAQCIDTEEFETKGNKQKDEVCSIVDCNEKGCGRYFNGLAVCNKHAYGIDK